MAKFLTQSGLNFQTTAIFYDEIVWVIQTLSQHQLEGEVKADEIGETEACGTETPSARVNET